MGARSYGSSSTLQIVTSLTDAPSISLRGVRRFYDVVGGALDLLAPFDGARRRALELGDAAARQRVVESLRHGPHGGGTLGRRAGDAALAGVDASSTMAASRRVASPFAARASRRATSSPNRSRSGRGPRVLRPRSPSGRRRDRDRRPAARSRRRVLRPRRSPHALPEPRARSWVPSRPGAAPPRRVSPVASPVSATTRVAASSRRVGVPGARGGRRRDARAGSENETAPPFPRDEPAAGFTSRWPSPRRSWAGGGVVAGAPKGRWRSGSAATLGPVAARGDGDSRSPLLQRATPS